MKTGVLVWKSFVWNFSTSYTLFGVCMRLCVCVCDLGWRCAPTSTHPHSQYLWLAYQVKSYTFYKSVGCIGVCARLLWESCISHNASELCGSILNRKNFHQNRSEFSAATRLKFIRVARKLIRTIKHAVWIEYYIWLLAMPQVFPSKFKAIVPCTFVCVDSKIVKSSFC